MLDSFQNVNIIRVRHTSHVTIRHVTIYISHVRHMSHVTITHVTKGITVTANQIMDSKKKLLWNLVFGFAMESNIPCSL